MLPALLLLRVGKHRRVWIPLPILLLWPFWFLGWAVWFVLWIFGLQWSRPLRAILMIGAFISGLRMDVDSANGDHIHIRMI